MTPHFVAMERLAKLAGPGFLRVYRLGSSLEFNSEIYYLNISLGGHLFGAGYLIFVGSHGGSRGSHHQQPGGSGGRRRRPVSAAGNVDAALRSDGAAREIGRTRFFASLSIGSRVTPKYSLNISFGSFVRGGLFDFCRLAVFVWESLFRKRVIFVGNESFFPLVSKLL
jgi:hypothetical protein